MIALDGRGNRLLVGRRGGRRRALCTPPARQRRDVVEDLDGVRGVGAEQQVTRSRNRVEGVENLPGGLWAATGALPGHPGQQVGRRSILLVSDGEPTCKPDPCTVARELAKQGIDLEIDVVGLDVNSAARSKLQCIAHAGHGVYYDVDNPKDLVKSVQKVATRAARPYEEIGKPVTGGNTSLTPAPIGNGDWLHHTNGHQDRFYTITRTMKNSTLHFSAVIRSPDLDPFNEVYLTTAGGQQCDASGNVTQQGRYQLLSTAVLAGPLDAFGQVGRSGDPCLIADTLLARVHYTGETAGVPVEIRVLELPEVRNIDGLPDPAKKPIWATPTTLSSPKQVRGGTSFNDASTLASGSYTDDIVQGETLTYHVQLDWGQRLDAKVAFAELDDAHRGAALGNPLVRVAVFSPARVPRVPKMVGTIPRRRPFSRRGPTSPPPPGRSTSATRERATQALPGSDVAGTYTIVMFLAKQPFCAILGRTDVLGRHIGRRWLPDRSGTGRPGRAGVARRRRPGVVAAA